MSMEDYIDTEPIPTQQDLISEGESRWSKERTTPRRRSLIRAVGSVAGYGTILLGAAGGIGVAIYPYINSNEQAEILNASLPPETERNILVTDAVTELLDDSSVKIACDTETTFPLGTQQDKYRVAYVERHTRFNKEVFVPPYITINDQLCTDILAFNEPELEDTYLQQLREQKFGQAAAILLHEYEHINGELDEAAATCYGIQKLPETLAPYFETATEAIDLAKITATSLSPLFVSSYLSEECSPGGEYDLGIGEVYILPPGSSNG